MSPAPSPDSTQAFEAALARLESEAYVLRLYVVGMTERSRAAIHNITAICEAHLRGRYTLEVVDLYQHPVLHEGDEIIAAPTLIKQLPLPLRTFIGDLSDTERILVGLQLRPKT
jgi:circadian clock protein KaiB